MPKQLTLQEIKIFQDFMKKFPGTVNEPNDDGTLPLNAALAINTADDRFDMVRILLKQDANPILNSNNVGIDRGIFMNAAGYAAACGHAKELREIISVYPDAINTHTGRDNISLLELAIMYSDRHDNFSTLMESVQTALDLNKKTCLVGDDKVSPVIFAAANHKVLAVEWFIRNNISLDSGIPKCPNVLSVAKYYEFHDLCDAIIALKPELAPPAAAEPHSQDEHNMMEDKIKALKAKKEAQKTGPKRLSEAGPADLPVPVKKVVVSEAAAPAKPIISADYTDLMRACGGSGNGVKPWADVKALLKIENVNTKLSPDHKDAGKTAFVFLCRPFKGADPIKVGLDEANRVQAAMTLVKDPGFDYVGNNYVVAKQNITFSAFNIAVTGNSPKVLDALWEKVAAIDLEEMSSGKTSLTLAMGNNISTSVFKWLVDHGANVNVQYKTKVSGQECIKTPFVDLCERVLLNPFMNSDDAKVIHAKARSILNSDRLDIAKIKTDTTITVMHYAVVLKDTRTVHDVCEKYPELAIEVAGGTTPLQLLAALYPSAMPDTQNVFNAIAIELITHGADAADIEGVIDLSAVNIPAAHAQFVVNYAALDTAYATEQVAHELMAVHIAGQTGVDE